MESPNSMTAVGNAGIKPSFEDSTAIALKTFAASAQTAVTSLECRLDFAEAKIKAIALVLKLKFDIDISHIVGVLK